MDREQADSCWGWGGLEWVEGLSQKGKKREGTHGHRQQCGECQLWGRVGGGGYRGINGGGKK